jgi:hypothetical protein
MTPHEMATMLLGMETINTSSVNVYSLDEMNIVYEPEMK